MTEITMWLHIVNFVMSFTLLSSCFIVVALLYMKCCSGKKCTLCFQNARRPSCLKGNNEPDSLADGDSGIANNPMRTHSNTLDMTPTRSLPEQFDSTEYNSDSTWSDSPRTKASTYQCPHCQGSISIQRFPASK